MYVACKAREKLQRVTNAFSPALQTIGRFARLVKVMEVTADFARPEGQGLED